MARRAHDAGAPALRGGFANLTALLVLLGIALAGLVRAAAGVVLAAITCPSAIAGQVDDTKWCIAGLVMLTAGLALAFIPAAVVLGPGAAGAAIHAIEFGFLMLFGFI